MKDIDDSFVLELNDATGAKINTVNFEKQIENSKMLIIKNKEALNKDENNFHFVKLSGFVPSNNKGSDFLYYLTQGGYLLKINSIDNTEIYMLDFIKKIWIYRPDLKESIKENFLNLQPMIGYNDIYEIEKKNISGFSK